MKQRLKVLILVLLACAIAIPTSLFSSGKNVQAAHPNLIPNPSFENENGWDVTFRGDAIGSFERDSSIARTGNHAMKLTKENGLGHVRLTTAQPIQVEAGKEYTFRGYFHSKEAPVSSLLLFRVADQNDQRLAYDDIDRSHGYTSQSMLINSPSGYWEKRVISFKAEQDEEIYLHVVLYGNPATVWLDDLEFSTEPYEIPRAITSEYDFPYTEDEVLNILDERKNVTASVDTSGDAAKLIVNGDPSPVVIYKGLESNDRSGDEEQFGQDGVQHVVTKVNLGPVYYDHVWKGAGQYDFTVMEDAIMSSLRKNPHANIIVDFWIYPYKTWGEEHLQEVKQNINGDYAFGTTFNIAGYTSDLSSLPPSSIERWYYPSYQSDQWKQDAGEAIRASIEHLKSTDLWKSVMGFYLTSGHDGTLIPHDYDYSEPSQADFREWLEEQYGDIQSLNDVWKESYEDFSQITIPPHPAGATMEDSPATLEKGAVTDYAAFREKGAWDYRDHFAKIVKDTTDKSVITIAYGKNSPHFGKTAYLDAIGTMTHYPVRNLGYSVGWKYGTPEILKSKLMLQELDLRSWSGSRYDEVYQMWIGAGLTPNEWEHIHKKLVGISLANGLGHWYYDMHQYFNDPEIHERIAKSYDVVEEVFNQPNELKPDVAVISTGRAEDFLGSDFNPVFPSVYSYATMMLETSGVPYDAHYLEDILENPEWRDYSIYIFQNEAYLSSEEREQIDQLLKRDGNIIIWEHNTGYVSDSGKSAENISDLVGMNVETIEEYTRLTPQMEAGAHEIVEGVLPLQSTSELYLSKFTLQGRTPFVSRYQPFWIEDDETITLATYAENGETAMAVKQFDDWTSIYLGAPNSLGNDLLNRIAQYADAYVVGEAGQSINMNSNFISLHGMKTEPYTIYLPEGKNRVVDAESGAILADGVTEYTFDVEAQKTYWFILEQTLAADHMVALVDQFAQSGDIANESIARALRIHLTSVGHFEKNNQTEKVVQHMQGFHTLLEQFKAGELISQGAYDELKRNADALINRMIASLLQVDVQLQNLTAVPGETNHVHVQLKNTSDITMEGIGVTIHLPEEFSLQQDHEIIGQLAMGHSEEIVFAIEVPSGVHIGAYPIAIDVTFDYQGVNMDLSKDLQVEVLPLLGGSLITDAIRVNKAGHYPVSLTLTNNASQPVQVEVTAESSENITLDLNSIHINPGRTEIVSGNLQITNDVPDGDYEVTIQTSVDGTTVQEFPLTVNIHKNMVRNPGFEDGDTVPAYWTMGPNSEWVQDEVHSGNYALSMIPGTHDVYTLWRHELPVEQGKTYRASFWAKNDSTNGGMFGIRRIGEANLSIDWLWVDVDRESDWTHYSFTFSPTEETLTISVYMRLLERLGDDGQIWFDDIRVEEVVEE